MTDKTNVEITDESESGQLVWHKALDLDELPEGRVKPVIPFGLPDATIL